MGSAIPWKALRNNANELDQRGSQMTKQNAELLGQIKTNLLNVFDAYDSCEQTVREWCDYTSSIMQRYIHFANQPAVGERKFHMGFLINVLSNSIKNFEKARTHVDNLSSAFNVLSRQLYTLESNLQRDYNENSAYFKQRLDQLVNSQSSGWFSRRKSRQEIAANLKKDLQLALAFYQRLVATVRKAIDTIAQTNSQLPSRIRAIVEQKAHLERIVDVHAPPTADHDPSQNHRGAIHSAEKLVSLCQNYRREHE